MFAGDDIKDFFLLLLLLVFVIEWNVGGGHPVQAR